jgi:hypothetical protein
LAIGWPGTWWATTLAADEAAPARAAGYMQRSAEMQAAADRTFDPSAAAVYRELAEQWRRLAQEVIRRRETFVDYSVSPDRRDHRP